MDDLGDPSVLRSRAHSIRAHSKTLPLGPQRARVARIASFYEDAAEEIDDMSPEMREDLRQMLASVRPQ